MGCGARPARIARPFFLAELDAVGSDQVERTFEVDAVDDDPDQVAVAEPANRSTGQCLGARHGRRTHQWKPLRIERP